MSFADAFGLDDGGGSSWETPPTGGGLGDSAAAGVGGSVVTDSWTPTDPTQSAGDAVVDYATPLLQTDPVAPSSAAPRASGWTDGQKLAAAAAVAVVGYLVLSR